MPPAGLHAHRATAGHRRDGAAGCPELARAGRHGAGAGNDAPAGRWNAGAASGAGPVGQRPGRAAADGQHHGAGLGRPGAAHDAPQQRRPRRGRAGGGLDTPQRRWHGPVAALAIAAGAHTRAVAAGLAAGGPMGAHPGGGRAALRGRAAAAGRLADLLLPGRGLVQPLVQQRLGQQFRRHSRRPAPANHLAGQPGVGRPTHARLGQPGARREALMRRASPGLRRRARGAALLLAMLTVTLVATFAAAAMWQQWRAVEIESAERARVQSAWILVGALDWSRLILFEDKRSDDGTDHLAEPWAVPLQEARLSTFLAADRNVTQMQDASTDTTEAFLSGAVSDLQGRLNIGNLFQGGRVQPLAQRQFGRLFARLGLSDQQLNLLVDGMREAQAGAGEGSTAPLLPPGVTQLGWLGLTP